MPRHAKTRPWSSARGDSAWASTDGSLCELYGTWGERKFMGKKYMGIGRSTFVIDKQGKLAHADYKVKAKGHAQAMLDLVRSLE